MDEKTLLRGLTGKNPLALEQAIDRYGGYVTAVLRGRGGGQLGDQDVEELASDVFLTLWQRAGEIRAGRLRPWLGAVARNRAVDRLRRQKLSLPLEEDCVVVDDGLWEALDREQRARLVREALSRLSPQDREIFYRCYDLCQSSTEIAAAMGLSASTVRTRLSRGRKTLKQILEQGGIRDEAAL